MCANALKISGINLVTYYAATIFENSLGMSPFMARLLSALNGTECESLVSQSHENLLTDML